LAPPIQLGSTLRPKGLRSSARSGLHPSARSDQRPRLSSRSLWSLVRWRPAASCPACGMSAFAWARRVFQRGGKHGRLGLNCWRFAPVAQGIEQRFPKPRVGGSNPSRRAPKLPANSRKTQVPRSAPGPFDTTLTPPQDSRCKTPRLVEGVSLTGTPPVSPEVSHKLRIDGVLGRSLQDLA
jgi:hypothetical protein